VLLVPQELLVQKVPMMLAERQVQSALWVQQAV
jgi:hypothetical protein